MTSFVEVADRVYVLRHPVLDVNVTLVVGEGAAVVVDTLSTAEQGAALHEAVRAVTPAPLTVVLTHHHFDHCFGTDALRPVEVWAHEEAARLLRATDPVEVGRAWAGHHPDLAGLATATVRVPDRTVHIDSTVDVGGRRVVLRHPGRGHTAGDLVVEVPDAGVVIAGDLVEQGGPPQFGDAFPLDWPESLAGILASGADLVVPGHGEVCDAAFVRAQHDRLAELAWLVRDGHADCAPAEAVAALAPFDPATALVAVRRGYAELSGLA